MFFLLKTGKSVQKTIKFLLFFKICEMSKHSYYWIYAFIDIQLAYFYITDT